MTAIGKSRWCPSGHWYSGATYTDGTRRCLGCAEEKKRRMRAREARLRAAAKPVRDTSWRFRSGCRGADPRLFEPMTRREATECDNDPHKLDRVQVALSYCDSCPVRGDCLDWAAAEGEQGVWGGGYLSREGRRKITKGAA